MDIGRLSIQIEERHLLKLLMFFGVVSTSPHRDSEVLDKAKVSLHRFSAVFGKNTGSTRAAHFINVFASVPTRVKPGKVK